MYVCLESSAGLLTRCSEKQREIEMKDGKKEQFWIGEKEEKIDA